MKPYIPKEFQEEENRLMQLILSSEEELDIEEFIEKYASKEYKQYLKDDEEETVKLWAQGIIVN